MCCSNHHKSRKHHSDRKPFLKIGLGIGASLLLLGAGYGYWGNRQTAKAALLKYSPQDVVYNQPLRASHLHNLGTETPIPFLPKDQPQPAIALSETTYDFGSVGPKDVVKRTVAIRNTGKAPLTISKAYTTCGCTTADFTSTVIPSGKVALVTVTFDAGFHDTRGMQVRRGVMIENNDPNQSKAEIWVTANVRQS
ncbi:MAG TPA: hypothetical protein DDZ80_06650 [Cyanobacteria bacterium UBA8803]|nr:hypothetical protein [Cyanobacteria bacterium UBA9273]HBL58203.1 hypothetical protein [Cyanobacteria bacterium UBA8803]